MKKIKFILSSLCLTILSSVTLTVTAANVGDVIGQVLKTDIVTRIDKTDIRSYNINNFTAIVAEDLLQYGFDVVWNPSNRTLSVTKAENKAITSTYKATKAYPQEIGMPAGDVIYSDIKTYINGQLTASFNIGGVTCIYAHALQEAGYGTLSFDNTSRLLTIAISQKSHKYDDKALPLIDL